MRSQLDLPQEKETKSKLHILADSLFNKYKPESKKDENAILEFKNIQAKFALSNIDELAKKIEKLPGVVLKEPNHNETDIYIITEESSEVKPNFETEYLRLRVKTVNETDYIYSLVYKTDSETVEGNLNLRTINRISLNYVQAIDLLDNVLTHNRYREVKKDRTTYYYKGIFINIDQNLFFRDENMDNDKLVGGGCFIEFMLEKPSEMVDFDELAKSLGVKTSRIDEPYANVDYFIQNQFNHFGDKKDSVIEKEIKNHSFVDYDAKNDCLTNEVNWQDFVSWNNGNNFNDVEELDALKTDIMKKLHVLFENVNINNPNRNILDVFRNEISQKHGNGAKLLEGFIVDGLKHYPNSIRKHLKQHVTFEIKGLSSKHFSDDGVRAFFTIARTKDNKIVVFPHKILQTKNGQDKWCNQHKK